MMEKSVKSLKFRDFLGMVEDLVRLTSKGEISAADVKHALDRVGVGQKLSDESSPIELDATIDHTPNQDAAPPRDSFSVDEEVDPSKQRSALHREIFDQFEDVRPLDVGGNAEVYKVKQVGLDREVALKLILSNDENALASFLKEARAIASLTHQNIVTIHDVSISSEFGYGYYLMELITDGSLKQLLKQRGVLKPKLAARLVSEVANAIHHAHKHDEPIIHRDIKPGNIMLKGKRDDDLKAIVVDFGLHKVLSQNAAGVAASRIAGTPLYMSPEQAKGGSVTERTDVYGIGSTLYKLLTSRAPLFSSGTTASLQLILSHDAVPPRLLDPNIDKEIEAICMKCLEKDPADRYQSAKELEEELRRYLDGSRIQTPLLDESNSMQIATKHSSEKHAFTEHQLDQYKSNTAEFLLDYLEWAIARAEVATKKDSGFPITAVYRTITGRDAKNSNSCKTEYNKILLMNPDCFGQKIQTSDELLRLACELKDRNKQIREIVETELKRRKAQSSQELKAPERRK